MAVPEETLELKPAGETPALVRVGFIVITTLGIVAVGLFAYLVAVGSKQAALPIIWIIPLLAFWVYLIVLRGSARTPVSIVCGSDRVTLRHWGGESDVYWQHVTRVHVRHAPDRRDGLSYGETLGRSIYPTFPAYLIVQAGESSRMGLYGLPDAIALAPEYLSPRDLYTVLGWMLDHCPPKTIDPEVLLMYGVVSRLVDDRVDAAWTTLGDGRLSTQKILQASPREPTGLAVQAGFAYFAGRFHDAARWSAAVLKADSATWDMLLCQALCARLSGDGARAEVVLEPVLKSASTPERIRALLTAALGVGAESWYHPVL